MTMLLISPCWCCTWNRSDSPYRAECHRPWDTDSGGNLPWCRLESNIIIREVVYHAS